MLGPRQTVRLYIVEPHRLVVDALRHVYADIDRLEKTSRTHQGFVERDERFAWFAIPGLLLVLAELGLSATRFRRVP